MQSGAGNQQQGGQAGPLAGKEISIHKPEQRAGGGLEHPVKFEYDVDLREYLKQLPSSYRSWDSDRRAWYCPVEHIEAVRAHFRAAGVQINNVGIVDAGLVREKLDMVPRVCQEEFQERLGRLPEELLVRLFPYQRAGVEFGIKRRGRVLIADEPGLGKTVQAIAIAAAFVDDWPLLVVCPSTLRCVWQQQLQEWLPPKIWARCCIVPIMKGEEAKKATSMPPRPYQITIASYDLVQKLEPGYISHHRFVIADESHMLANLDSNRTRFLSPIIQQAPHAILLSGTPLQAKPIELFSQIQMLRQGLLGSRDNYGRRYCGGVKQQIRGNFYDYVGASNSEELHGLLEATIMIRRLKKHVLQDLPDKIRKTINVEIDENAHRNLRRLQGEMSQVERQPGMSEIEKKSAVQQLVNELCRATGQAKIRGVATHIGHLLDAGHKLLVFGHHEVVMDALESAVAEMGVAYVRVDGSTIPARRATAVQDFQGNDHVRVALLSIKAAGTGLTLTEASAVVFAELAWSPSDLTQAEDRAHRVGQQKTLQVHYMMAAAEESADKMMWRKLQGKLRTVGGVVDGNQVDTATGLRVNDSQLPEIQARRLAQPQTPGGTAAGQPSQTPVAPTGPRKLPRSFTTAGPSHSQPSTRYDESEPPAARRRLNFGGASVPIYHPPAEQQGEVTIDLTAGDYDGPAAGARDLVQPLGEGASQGFPSQTGTPGSQRHQTQEQLAGVFGTPNPRQTQEQLAGVFGSEPEGCPTDEDVVCLD